MYVKFLLYYNWTGHNFKNTPLAQTNYKTKDSQCYIPLFDPYRKGTPNNTSAVFIVLIFYFFIFFNKIILKNSC